MARLGGMAMAGQRGRQRQRAAAATVSGQSLANSLRLSAANDPSDVDHACVMGMVSSFTPLHTKGPRVWTSAFCVNVWGGSPPRRASGHGELVPDAVHENLAVTRCTVRTRSTRRTTKTRHSNPLDPCLRLLGIVGTLNQFIFMIYLVLVNVYNFYYLDTWNNGFARTIAEVKVDIRTMNDIGLM